jgi:outer membrane protein assembly factor BamB
MRPKKDYAAFSYFPFSNKQICSAKLIAEYRLPLIMEKTRFMQLITHLAHEFFAAKEVKKAKHLWAVAVLALLLILPAFIAISNLRESTVNASTASENTGETNDDILLQYEWPQFMGDSAFSRFSTGPAPSTSAILWKTNITGIQSYISAFNGMIFVATTTSVFALNRETGDIIWNTTVSMHGTWPIAYKIDDARMVVEASCLETQTGRILWTSSDFSADTGIFTANVYSPEEKMFYTKVDSYVKAWSFSDPSKPPTLQWTTYVPGGTRVGSGITYGDGKVFPGSMQSHQMALDAKSGEVLWDTLTKGPMIFTGSYYQGRFLRGGTDDNTMYCFNATTGEIMWTFTPDTDGYFTSSCAVAYGMVYELNKDGHLYAFDVDTGDLVWKYQGPSTLLWPGSPTIADGKIYATTGQAAMYGEEEGTSEFACLDAYTGQLLWKLPIEAFAPRESVAIAYGRLYLIPGNVTTAVDSVSGSEYTTINQVWAIGASSPLVDSSPWSMFRKDAAHSSVAYGGPSNLTLAWNFTTGGAVISSPSVADGIVYVGSQDKYVYALGAWSGNLIWKFKTLGTIESSPAVANGRVFTGGDDGYVYCLDAYQGTLLWKTFINGNLEITYGSAVILRSSPTVVGNKVYIGSLDGYLYALDANFGNVVWKFKTEGAVMSSPAVADGAVYFSSQEPTSAAIYKVDANNGGLLWKKPVPYEWQFTGGSDMLGSPSVADGMVFASSNMRTFYGIDAASGDIKWNFTDPSATEFLVSVPIYVDGELWIIDKYSITAVNASTGQTIRSFFTGDELYVAPSYSDSKIYVVTSQRHIFVLNATGGEKLSVATTPSSSWSSPAIYGGRLYVGNNDWNVYCYAPTITISEPEPSATPVTETIPAYYVYAVFVAAVVAIVVIIVAYAFFVRRKTSSSSPTEAKDTPQ